MRLSLSDRDVIKILTRLEAQSNPWNRMAENETNRVLLLALCSRGSRIEALKYSVMVPIRHNRGCLHSCDYCNRSLGLILIASCYQISCCGVEHLLDMLHGS